MTGADARRRFHFAVIEKAESLPHRRESGIQGDGSPPAMLPNRHRPTPTPSSLVNPFPERETACLIPKPSIPSGRRWN